MAGASPLFFNSPKTSNATIVPADTTSAKTVVTAPAGGSKVSALIFTMDDTSARDIQFGITQSGGSFYPIGMVNVPVTAGFVAATPGVNAFNRTTCPGLPLDSDGNPYLLLESGDKLEIKAASTLTAAKTLYATAIHADAI